MCIVFETAPGIPEHRSFCAQPQQGISTQGVDASAGERKAPFCKIHLRSVVRFPILVILPQ